MIWVDVEGNLIEAVEAGELERGVDVPLLVGCSTAEFQKNCMQIGTSTLDALRRNFPEFYLRLASLDVSSEAHLAVYLKDYDGPLWLHPEDVLRNLKNLQAVWETLSKRYVSPAYVDLRWHDQIVVMPSEAVAHETVAQRLKEM